MAQDRALAQLGIERRRVGDILVVSLSGRITEAFEAKVLARDLAGVVVFDLGRVKSITSYGVRVWMEMLTEAQPRLTGLYLARCSQAIVNQLNMIRNFAGGGRVISFAGPYHCELCGHEFERLFDCEQDAEAIERMDSPPGKCPRCGAVGRLDDDPLAYFSFFAAYRATEPIPEAVRLALEAQGTELPGIPSSIVTPAMGDRIEKTIEGRTTRIRINCALDKTLRWDRITDGLEGPVVIDLSAVPEVTPEGAVGFERMLRALPPEVASLQVEGCPPTVLEQLAASTAPQRAVVLSAVIVGHCASCASARRVLVDVRKDSDAMRAGREPRVPCDRCGAILSFIKALRLLRYLGRQAPLQLPAEVVPGPGSTPETPVVLGGSNTALRLGVIAIGVMVVTALSILLFKKAQPSRPVLVSASTSAPAAGTEPGGSRTSPGQVARVVDLPPAWVERNFLLEGEEVVFVGHGGPTAAEDAAVLAARNDALERLTARMLAELSGTSLYDFVRARLGTDRRPEERADPRGEVRDRIARRYLEQVGALATPERVEAVMRRSERGTEAFVRYKLPRTAFVAAIRAYRYTQSFRGMTVARYFPQLEWVRPAETPGALVVSVRRSSPAGGAGVHVGDVVTEVNGRRVYSAEDFAKISSSEWHATPAGGLLAVRLENDGRERAVSLKKPVPPPPPPLPLPLVPPATTPSAPTPNPAPGPRNVPSQ